ncbi:MAG: hypothetical protein HZB55_07610 [Deltaproteobacteria bacterium]|nr:hypothetical protein [Deltaproteobacteria bacterium]
MAERPHLWHDGGAGVFVGPLLALLFDQPRARSAEPARVASIEAPGARRTTRDTAFTPARVREGDPWSEGQEGEVLQNLRNARLFYDESVEVLREGDSVGFRTSGP